MSPIILDISEFLGELEEIERTPLNQGVLDTCHFYGWHAVLRELVKEAALTVGQVRPAGFHIFRWFEAAAKRELLADSVTEFYSSYLDQYVLAFSEQLRPFISRGEVWLPDKVIAGYLRPKYTRYGRLFVRMAMDVNIVGQALDDLGHDQGQLIDKLILDF